MTNQEKSQRQTRNFKNIRAADKAWYDEVTQFLPDTHSFHKGALVWKNQKNRNSVSLKPSISKKDGKEYFILGLWDSDNDPFYVARFTDAELSKNVRATALSKFLGDWIKGVHINTIAIDHRDLLKYNDAALAWRLSKERRNAS